MVCVGRERLDELCAELLASTSKRGMKSKLARPNRTTIIFVSFYGFDDSNIIVDYSGTFSEKNLILDSYSHANAYEGKNRRYVNINIGNKGGRLTQRAKNGS
jgi:hypothetical protein